MTQISVRVADERDLEALAALHRVVHDLHVAAAPDDFKPVSDDVALELMRSRLCRPDTRVWIALVAGEPAGHAIALLRERPETAIARGRRYVEVDELAVSPARRGIGVARALIARILQHARELGCADVELTTWAFNLEARAAFAALGFEPIHGRFRRRAEDDTKESAS